MARVGSWSAARWWRGSLVALSTLFCLAAAQAQAQGGPGGGWGGAGGGWGGRGGGGWGGRGGPGRMEHRPGVQLPSPEQLEGPPSPTELRQVADLSGDQTDRYRKSYDGHMDSTKALRDSVRTAMHAMREAFRSDDRTTAREQRELAERGWKTLSSRDDKFGKVLKKLLTKDQTKRYDDWNNDRKRDAEDRFRGPPGDDRERGTP